MTLTSLTAYRTELGPVIVLSSPAWRQPLIFNPRDNGIAGSSRLRACSGLDDSGTPELVAYSSQPGQPPIFSAAHASLDHEIELVDLAWIGLRPLSNRLDVVRKVGDDKLLAVRIDCQREHDMDWYEVAIDDLEVGEDYRFLRYTNMTYGRQELTGYTWLYSFEKLQDMATPLAAV